MSRLRDARLPARHGTPATPADLARYELIGFRNNGTGKGEAWRFRRGCGIGPAAEIERHSPNARLVFDDALSAWAMARAGHGIACAPERLALDGLRCGHAAEMLKRWRYGEMPMSVLRRERRLTPKWTEMVITLLHDAADGWRAPSSLEPCASAG